MMNINGLSSKALEELKEARTALNAAQVHWSGVCDELGELMKAGEVSAAIALRNTEREKLRAAYDRVVNAVVTFSMGQISRGTAEYLVNFKLDELDKIIFRAA